MLNFFETVSKLGTAYRKPMVGVKESPLEAMKRKFGQGIEKHIALLNGKPWDKNDKPRWYEVKDGKYIVHLRNANVVLQLDGASQITHMIVDSKEKAVKFFQAALAASEEGAFDEQFIATARKPNKSKSGAAITARSAPAVPAATVAAEAAAIEKHNREVKPAAKKTRARK
jgi:hypothetical protein